MGAPTHPPSEVDTPGDDPSVSTAADGSQAHPTDPAPDSVWTEAMWVEYIATLYRRRHKWGSTLARCLVAWRARGDRGELDLSHCDLGPLAVEWLMVALPSMTGVVKVGGYY
ncbi:hypothetical protein KIPB_010220 [Kipferlia bialata]|uniref:Uncharacterized protein n=1 Tax=Kipferlia bialata TaxID=797122 RepID=A0A391NPQ6_9EUKA|nr:hypothetical protein KIPB_010220 [Kipferlia bialata]|eukprot:g10220.t1